MKLINAFRCAFVDEDRMIATFKAENVIEYDLGADKEVHRFKGLKYMTSVSVSPSGQRIAVSTSEDRFAVFDRAGELIYKQKIDSEIHGGVAWSPDSSLFAMAHHRSRLALHNAVTGREVKSVSAGWVGRVRAMDSRLLLIDKVLTDDMAVRFQFFDWELNALGDPLVLPPCPDLESFCGDFSKVVATYNREIRVFDSSGELLNSFQSPENQVIASIAMHPDGHEIAVVSTEGDVYRVNASSGEILFPTRLDFGVVCDYSPLGSKLIVLGMKKSLLLDISGESDR